MSEFRLSKENLLCIPRCYLGSLDHRTGFIGFDRYRIMDYLSPSRLVFHAPATLETDHRFKQVWSGCVFVHDGAALVFPGADGSEEHRSILLMGPVVNGDLGTIGSCGITPAHESLAQEIMWTAGMLPYDAARRIIGARKLRPFTWSSMSLVGVISDEGDPKRYDRLVFVCEVTMRKPPAVSRPLFRGYRRPELIPIPQISVKPHEIGAWSRHLLVGWDRRESIR